LVKGYSTREVSAPWASWQRDWVAEDGELLSFACVEHEPWHQRLTPWFLHIAPSHRRACVGARSWRRQRPWRRVAASHVWLETSNVSVPGVRAYERRGYALCGADTRYYGAYMPGETALYFAKPM
jgi:hypothetical protein